LTSFSHDWSSDVCSSDLTKLLLKTQTGIMRLRGTWSTYVTPSGVEIPAMPTLHPAYLLRNPAHKKLAWRDFLEVKARLREMEGEIGSASCRVLGMIEVDS